MVTRLSGGLTPGDGSDPRTFPAIWNVTADEIEAQGTAISGAESDIDVLEGKNIPAFGTAMPSDGQVLTFDSAGSEYVPEDVVASLADLTDTDISAPSSGEVLEYDGTNWVNSAGGGLVAVKSAINTGPEVFGSVAGGGNVAVPGLSITHEVSDPANKLIITAVFGVAANSDGSGETAIAVHDGTSLIGVGDAAGSRTQVGAGGRTALDSYLNTNVSLSTTFVYTPGAGSKTYTVRAINAQNSTNTVYVNRSEGDTDSSGFPRGASSLVIQEVAV